MQLGTLLSYQVSLSRDGGALVFPRLLHLLDFFLLRVALRLALFSGLLWLHFERLFGVLQVLAFLLQRPNLLLKVLVVVLGFLVRLVELSELLAVVFQDFKQFLFFFLFALGLLQIDVCFLLYLDLLVLDVLLDFLLDGSRI